MSSETLTSLRLTLTVASGFRDEQEMAAAVLRLVEAKGESLSGASLSPDQARGVKAAMLHAPQIFAAFFKLIAHAATNEEDKANLRFMLVKLADDMLSLGILTSPNAEASSIGFSVLRGASEGGQQSGNTRREKGEIWRDIARPFIIRVRREKPTLSQGDVAAEVQALWTSKIPAAPPVSTLTALVAEMEREGVIPRRSRNQ